MKTLGYAGLKFIDMPDPFAIAAQAALEVEKYGGLIVLPEFDKAVLAMLMTLRQNIYTDPQKPIQVEPKIYAIGEPTKDSAVFVTTNFSLTYFIVSGEIENSGISAYLVVPECEGMSVLTAWAAGKFTGTLIAKAVKEFGLEQMVDTRRLVIPGYVAQISGELEENLPRLEGAGGPAGGRRSGELHQNGDVKRKIVYNTTKAGVHPPHPCSFWRRRLQTSAAFLEEKQQKTCATAVYTAVVGGLKGFPSTAMDMAVLYLFSLFFKKSGGSTRAEPSLICKEKDRCRRLLFCPPM